jgi:hypothetical protein
VRRIQPARFGGNTGTWGPPGGLAELRAAIVAITAPVLKDLPLAVKLGVTPL